MNTKTHVLLFASLIAIFITGCIQDFFVDGDGKVIEEVRTVPDFSTLNSAGSFNIYYEYAEENEITVSCESNIMMYIETVVYNKELIIRTPYNARIRPHEPIEVYVKGPYISGIQLSGSGTIETDTIYNPILSVEVNGSGEIETAFVGEKLYTSLPGSGSINAYANCDYAEARISGSGEIQLEGWATTAEYSIPGSGLIQAYDFEVQELHTKISGSGSMYVYATNYLDATVSGSGDVNYLGNPELRKHISGSGSINNRN